MSKDVKSLAYLSSALVPVLLASVSLSTPAQASCVGPGAPDNTQTKCVTAIRISGNALSSFDISWVNPNRAEYYLADRSNKGIDIIDTEHLKFERTIGGFVGIVIVLNGLVGGQQSLSGPDGVAVPPWQMALCR